MLIKSLKITLAAAAVILIFLLTWFYFEFNSPQKSQNIDTAFEIERGQSAGSIAQKLKDRGILKKKWPFELGYRAFYSSKSLKAGEYAFLRPISVKSVLKTIAEGRVALRSITIPEGFTRKEISNLIQSHSFLDGEDFLQASSDPGLIAALDDKAVDLEGYLYPETYRFPKGTTGKEISASMISQFKETFNEEWKRRAQEIGMTVRQIVILASLIEKETSRPQERSLVSSVFHNRLKIGMKLDCDPTIIYALKQEDRFRDRLRTRDLKYDTPYNTYLYKGLPPGPIANPGQGSLEAALYPADEKYLYFVSKNDGSHHFSRTFREHQNAVLQYQKRK